MPTPSPPSDVRSRVISPILIGVPGARPRTRSLCVVSEGLPKDRLLQRVYHYTGVAARLGVIPARRSPLRRLRHLHFDAHRAESTSGCRHRVHGPPSAPWRSHLPVAHGVIGLRDDRCAGPRGTAPPIASPTARTPPATAVPKRRRYCSTHKPATPDYYLLRRYLEALCQTSPMAAKQRGHPENEQHRDIAKRRSTALGSLSARAANAVVVRRRPMPTTAYGSGVSDSSLQPTWESLLQSFCQIPPTSTPSTVCTA